MSQPLIIDGVELTPVPEHPHTYRYTPLAATVARDNAGRAQISLIKAGTFAMLNCTTMWGVTGAALEVARAKLAAQLRLAEPSQVTLTPAPVEVGPVELLLGDGSGRFDTLLTAQSSGMPPYSAAFSATLTEAQRTSVEKALGGERGFLAVRYSVRESTAAVPHHADIDPEHLVQQHHGDQDHGFRDIDLARDEHRGGQRPFRRIAAGSRVIGEILSRRCRRLGHRRLSNPE